MSTYTEWTPELGAALSERFPEEAHQTKTQGGSNITFVAWHEYAHRLNVTVGPQNWSAGAPIFHEVGGKLVMAVPVTILGVTKVNVGDEDEDKDSFGTASTNAWAQAYKRSCALFGMGLYMYDKTGKRAERDRVADSDSRQQLAGLVEKLDGAGLTGEPAKIKKRALDLALNGGPQTKVDAAIAWATNTLNELEGAAT